MNRKSKNRSNQQREIIHKKVIRCRLHMRPVLQQENCSDFATVKDKETNKYCMNCKHSF